MVQTKIKINKKEKNSIFKNLQKREENRGKSLEKKLKSKISPKMKISLKTRPRATTLTSKANLDKLNSKEKDLRLLC